MDVDEDSNSLFTNMSSTTVIKEEFRVLGTYLEGVGDDVVAAVMMFILLVVSILIFLYKFKYLNPVNAIHPESQEDVNAARSHLHIDVDDTNNEEADNDPYSTDEASRRYYTDRKCPICLQEAQFAVETNCGHLFCGRCIITYWQYGNWLGAVQCPVCRQIVNLMMKDFPSVEESEESREIEREVNDYNRRFSGQPRPLMDYIRDLPAILRHLWREFFSVGGLVMMFRFRILLCFVAVIVYLLSPLDILPEAILGLIGLLDDLFILLLVLVYVTIIYRQFVAERGLY